VEERPGAVLSTEAAERELPRLDPPNVSWFAGAYAIAVGSYALLQTIPDSRRSLWIFIAALAFVVTYAVGAWLLLRSAWWVPGGLAAALAVAMMPAVSIAFLRVVRVWPRHLGDSFDDFSGYTLAVAGVTALAALVAFALTRFSFLFALFVGSILVGSQILAAASGSPSGDDRAVAALIAGALMVIVGVFLDAFGRRRDAFWFHALGWFSVAAGLVFFTFQPGGDHDRGWIPMLIIGALILVVSGPIRRATWAIYGVLGYYAPLVHYLSTGLNESRWTFAVALLAVGLSIFVLGMLLHRFGRPVAQRFVRRPPPEIA
jgi:hypothetical protein